MICEHGTAEQKAIRGVETRERDVDEVKRRATVFFIHFYCIIFATIFFLPPLFVLGTLPSRSLRDCASCVRLPAASLPRLPRVHSPSQIALHCLHPPFNGPTQRGATTLLHSSPPRDSSILHIDRALYIYRDNHKQYLVCCGLLWWNPLRHPQG